MLKIEIFVPRFLGIKTTSSTTSTAKMETEETEEPTALGLEPQWVTAPVKDKPQDNRQVQIVPKFPNINKLIGVRVEMSKTKSRKDL